MIRRLLSILYIYCIAATCCHAQEIDLKEMYAQLDQAISNAPYYIYGGRGNFLLGVPLEAMNLDTIIRSGVSLETSDKQIVIFKDEPVGECL